jgi:hypothetical protein
MFEFYDTAIYLTAEPSYSMMRGSYVAQWLFTSQEGLCTMKLVNFSDLKLWQSNMYILLFYIFPACVYSVFALGSGHMTGSFPVQGVLPAM